MTEQITLTLSTEVFRQAEALARQAGQPVGELLARTIEVSLRPLGPMPDDPPPETWSDEEVLAHTELTMPVGEDERLSELLGLQREGELTGADRAELQRLMGTYQQRLLKKAGALREAVRRGLREPLVP